MAALFAARSRAPHSSIFAPAFVASCALMRRPDACVANGPCAVEAATVKASGATESSVATAATVAARARQWLRCIQTFLTTFPPAG
eukprot:7391209-Prymnesium_polylepis.2